ncbi:gamma-glutamyl-phosphate reductase, partial [Kingella kingae]|nr:gamma-glutamyl-phosphate reductase [Kingella kingae]
KSAYYQLAQADSAAKNNTLIRLADLIATHETELLAANAQDIENGKQKGLTDALLDRLKITPSSLHTMREGLL